MSMKKELVSIGVSILTNENVQASLFGRHANGKPRTFSESINGNTLKDSPKKIHKKKKKKKKTKLKSGTPSIFKYR